MILFTSDKPVTEKRSVSVIGTYLLVTVGCALFGAVYELFSHEIYSYFMIYAFVFPLLLGAVPFFLMQKAGKPIPGKGADFVHTGVAALTVGSILKGALEIYGTTSPLIACYWAAGGVTAGFGWLLILRKGKSA